MKCTLNYPAFDVIQKIEFYFALYKEEVDLQSCIID